MNDLAPRPCIHEGQRVHRDVCPFCEIEVLGAALAAAEAAREEAKREVARLTKLEQGYAVAALEGAAMATTAQGNFAALADVSERWKARAQGAESRLAEVERALEEERTEHERRMAEAREDYQTEREQHITDIQCGERRLMKVESQRDTALARLAEVERERNEWRRRVGCRSSCTLACCDQDCDNSGVESSGWSAWDALDDTREALAAALRSAEQARANAIEEAAMIAHNRAVRWAESALRCQTPESRHVANTLAEAFSALGEQIRALLSAAPGEESAPPPTKKEG